MKRKKPVKSPTWNYELARTLLIEKDISRDRVAELIGMTEPSFTQNLNNRKPSIQTVKLLANVLGCAEKDLWTPVQKRKAAS